jgi:hypothetical protein
MQYCRHGKEQFKASMASGDHTAESDEDKAVKDRVREVLRAQIRFQD